LPTEKPARPLEGRAVGRLQLRLALVEEARQLLDAREGLGVVGLQLERQAVVEDGLGQAVARLEVARPALVAGDELGELFLHLRDALARAVVAGIACLDRVPGLEGAEAISLAVEPLAAFEGRGAGDRGQQQPRPGARIHPGVRAPPPGLASTSTA
jgi:hypothetical protein